MNDTEGFLVCPNTDDDHLCRVEIGPRQILQPPPGINERLARLGGLTYNGLPWFRLVWGWSRLGYIGGAEWHRPETPMFKPCPTHKDGCRCELKLYQKLVITPTQLVPKYWPYLDRWYVEMWNPPEAYGSPAAWKRVTTQFVPEWLGIADAIEGPLLSAGDQIDGLGPYPDRGDYEAMFVIEPAAGTPVTGDLVEKATLFVRQARWQARKLSRVARIAAAKVEEELAKQASLEDLGEWWAEQQTPRGDRMVGYGPKRKETVN